MDELLESKFQSMCDQIEKLQTVIDELLPYKETVEVMTHKLSTLTHIEYQAMKLHALEVGDPKIAICMLQKGCESYMYACKTIESKTQLMALALQTDNPQIILSVSIFLYFSLDTENFGTLVMKCNFASKQFLHEYLLHRSFEEFRMVCQRYGRAHDLNCELLKRNLDQNTLDAYRETRQL
jgi:hypothetical protein